MIKPVFQRYRLEPISPEEHDRILYGHHLERLNHPARRFIRPSTPLADQIRAYFGDYEFHEVGGWQLKPKAEKSSGVPSDTRTLVRYPGFFSAFSNPNSVD